MGSGVNIAIRILRLSSAIKKFHQFLMVKINLNQPRKTVLRFQKNGKSYVFTVKRIQKLPSVRKNHNLRKIVLRFQRNGKSYVFTVKRILKLKSVTKNLNHNLRKPVLRFQRNSKSGVSTAKRIQKLRNVLN